MLNVRKLLTNVDLLNIKNKCFISLTSINKKKSSIPIKDILLKKNINIQTQPQYQTAMIPSFESTTIQRRSEAKRSIYIQFDLQNKELLLNILNDLENLNANINNVFFFRNIKYNAVLIEFNTYEFLKHFLSSKCSQFDHVANRPIQTRSLFYRASRRQQKCKNYNYLIEFTQKLISDEEKLSQMLNLKCDYIKMYEWLKEKHGNSFSKQLQRYYTLIKLDEISIRARYFVASLVEDTLISLFPRILCLPFGSSASNFGKFDSDLDLTIFLEDKVLVPNEGLTNKITSNFYFNTKVIKESMSLQESERNEAKSNLALLLNLIRSYLPDFHSFESITTARVPIIKCKHRILADTLDIDISMNKINQSFSMTKLLWTYSMLDNNFVPLVYFIKDWASYLSITSSIKPNYNLSNYHLVLLVLNYLINKNIVPKLNDILVRNTSSLNEDELIPIKDITQIKFNYKNRLKSGINDDLIKLINGFFIEYSEFNFNDYRISFNANEKDTETFIKKDLSKPIFIENPLLPGSNVALNVSQIKLLDFQLKCKESINKIESNTNIIDFLNNLKKQFKNSNDDDNNNNEDFNNANILSNDLNYQV